MRITMNNKKPIKQKPATSSPDAERTAVQSARDTLARLEQQQRDHGERAGELASRRRALAFLAHGRHDAEAAKELADVTDAIVRHEVEAQALADAITEAQALLANAERSLAVAVDQAKAVELRGALASFRTGAKDADAALSSFKTAIHGITDSLNEMRVLGCTHPNTTQFEVAAWRFVICAALSDSIFSHRVERPAPNDRRSFVALCEQMSSAVERNIAQRLGEQTEERAA
jgi:hypothetical protein